MKVLSVRITPETWGNLKNYSRRHGQSPSETVRHLLDFLPIGGFNDNDSRPDDTATAGLEQGVQPAHEAR
jgi:hypothetical protein